MPDYQLLISLIRNRRPGTGVCPTVKRVLWACRSLEGGPASLPEGLEDSMRPCAGVLSVAGFFALMVRFLAGEGFILRVKGPLFSPGRPPLFNPRVKTVINTGLRHAVPGILVVHREAGRRVHTYLGYREAYSGRGTYPPCTGRHIGRGGVPTHHTLAQQ